VKKIALLVALSVIAAAPALAQGKTYSAATSTVGELLDNPATKAVFAKCLPEAYAGPNLAQSRNGTLQDLANVDETVTPEEIACLDAGLKALPQ
jgi:para-nitrobenzyl esterase